jgi:hypothetical protein
MHPLNMRQDCVALLAVQVAHLQQCVRPDQTPILVDRVEVEARAAQRHIPYLLQYKLNRFKSI